MPSLATGAAAVGPAAGVPVAPVPPRQPITSNSNLRRSSFSSSSIPNGTSTASKNRSGAAESKRPPRDSCFRLTRREVTRFMSLSFASSLLPIHLLAPALALDEVPEAFRVYSDDVNNYRIFIPQDWQVGTGDAKGIKSITAFYPEDASTSNVSVVVTGLGPDFTQLESFGKVDAFAESLVSGLDRSWQRPPGVAAKLIDCKSANGLYYIEYTLQKPGESRRHIYTAMGIGNNGWYNKLYTVTGQFLEDEWGRYGSTIEKAVQSFRLS